MNTLFTRFSGLVAFFGLIAGFNAFAVQTRQFPAECDFKDNAYKASCFMAWPDYCQWQDSANLPSCLGVKVADYCRWSENGNTLACIEAAPDYCQFEAYGDLLACAQSNPAYCKNEWNGNLKACWGSMPAYCDNDFFNRDKGACLPKVDFAACSKAFIAITDRNLIHVHVEKFCRP